MKKASIQVPSLEEDREITNAANAGPDARPLTEEQMGQMVPLNALRARPRLANRKQLVSIRYTPEVLDYFRSSGAGWQSRMDAVLREYVESRSGFDAEGPQHGHAPKPPPQIHYALWGSFLMALCGQVMASVHHIAEAFRHHDGQLVIVQATATAPLPCRKAHSPSLCQP
jgi:uncharacterized protein (DUF4415 family)